MAPADPGQCPEVLCFVPYCTGDGGMESPDYDTPEFRQEVASWFDALGLQWRWVPVTPANLAEVVAQAAGRLVLNLCDGADTNGHPGLAVVQALERAGVPFTGASAGFYKVSTHKVVMKERLASAGVPTPPFVRLEGADSLARLEFEVGFPAIIKPDVSAASMGISLRSVVHSRQGATDYVQRLLRGERDTLWARAGLFAERFIEGREFTVLVVTDREEPAGARAFPPAERVFHSALPPCERFLSYDRYWAFYREEPRLPEGEPFYRYAAVPSALSERLAELAVRAFCVLGGTGYGRVDIRGDAAGRLTVLEVNANCGLSGDLETSVGQILRLAGCPAHELIRLILSDALARGPRYLEG